ncbi:SPFH domain-containing protein [Pedobacter sp.]
MALFEVIKYNGNDSEFVWKFPTEDLKLGSQLIVNYSQTAFFVKNGQVLDEFSEGRYTIKSANIPLLNKLVNLPFGGEAPFSAEVWFVNKISKLDNKWGTVKPINLEDPVYNIVIPVRAFGQFGVKIVDSQSFLKTIVGNAKVFTADHIVEYFKGKILSSITTALSKKIVLDRISLLQIGVFQDQLSGFCQEEINKEFIKYGVEIVNFYFMSINIPEEDPSFIKLKEAKALAMHVNIVGKDIYQADRTFDVLQDAVNNQGGSSSIMDTGIGLGAGLGIGGILANQFASIGGNVNNLNNQPPTIPQSTLYFFVINGKQTEAVNIDKVEEMINTKAINENTLAWKKGLSQWVNAGELEEINNIFNSQPPSIPSI